MHTSRLLSQIDRMRKNERKRNIVESEEEEEKKLPYIEFDDDPEIEEVSTNAIAALREKGNNNNWAMVGDQ